MVPKRRQFGEVLSVRLAVPIVLSLGSLPRIGCHQPQSSPVTNLGMFYNKWLRMSLPTHSSRYGLEPSKVIHYKQWTATLRGVSEGQTAFFKLTSCRKVASSHQKTSSRSQKRTCAGTRKSWQAITFRSNHTLGVQKPLSAPKDNVPTNRKVSSSLPLLPRKADLIEALQQLSVADTI